MNNVHIEAREAELMDKFSNGDESFVLGEYRTWKDACFIAGRTLDPEPYKALKASRSAMKAIE